MVVLWSVQLSMPLADQRFGHLKDDAMLIRLPLRFFWLILSSAAISIVTSIYRVASAHRSGRC